MKLLRIKVYRAKTTIPLSVIFLSILFICSCNNELKVDSDAFLPPRADLESSFETFYPDSGGFGTKLIIKGQNLGTDTNYLKVTVNDKKAKIVKVNNDVLYAVVPVRADTGYVKLYVKKGEEFQEFVSDREFRYLFKSNVSTLFGVPGKQSPDVRQDGPYDQALLRRPWQITSDRDGTIYSVDEGRGNNKNGALRKASKGVVETLITNNNGPFQSPNSVIFNLTEDTLFMANRWTGDDVRTDVNIMYSTRDANFVNVKALLSFPRVGTNSIAVHPKTGELIFDGQNTGKIYRYTGNDTYTELGTIRPGQTGIESRLLFNKEGTILYIIARNKHCIYKATYDVATHTMGTPELWVGEWGSSGYASGIGTAVRFNEPSTSTLDPDGNIIVPDKKNHIIRKITPAGEVTLYAGQPNQSGHNDGLPDKAKFSEPEAVTFNGNALIVCDRANQCVRSVVIE